LKRTSVDQVNKQSAVKASPGIIQKAIKGIKYAEDMPKHIRDGVLYSLTKLLDLGVYTGATLPMKIFKSITRQNTKSIFKLESSRKMIHLGSQKFYMDNLSSIMKLSGDETIDKLIAAYNGI